MSDYNNNDSDTFLHVNSINRGVRERTKKSMYIYEDMLKKCFRRIKLAVDLGERSCFYTLPEIILGKPRYKMTECLKYMHDNIANYGYYVKYLPPNIFFISWVHAHNPNYKPITNEYVVKTSYQQYLENTKQTEEQEKLLPRAPAATGPAQATTNPIYKPLPNTQNPPMQFQQPSPMLQDSRLPLSLPQPVGQPKINLTNEHSNPAPTSAHTHKPEPSIFNIVPRTQTNGVRPWQQDEQSNNKPEYKPLKFNNDIKGIFK